MTILSRRGALLACCLLALQTSGLFADDAVRERLTKLVATRPDEQFEVSGQIAKAVEAEEKRSSLLPFLEDKDENIRFAAASVIGRFDPLTADESKALLGRFGDADKNRWSETVWLAAARSYGSRDPVELDTLRTALESTDPVVRRSGLVALHFSGSKQAARALEEIVPLMDDDDANVRRSAIGILQTIGKPAARYKQRVTPFLRHEDFHTQYWAARALGAMGELAASESKELVRALKVGNSSVKRNSAAALGNIGPKAGPEAAQALHVALGDPQVMVREAAAKAIGQFGDSGRFAADKLREMLKSHSSETRVAAARTLALFDLHVEPCIDAMIKELGRNNQPWAAAEALALFGKKAKPATDALIKALSALDPETRAAAAETLGGLGETKAVEALEKVAEGDAEGWVRKAAANALKELKAEASGE